MKTKKYTTINYLKDVWSFVKPYKWKFFLATLLRASGDIVNLYPAWAFSKIILLLTEGGEINTRQVFLYLAGWLGAVMYRSVFKPLGRGIAFAVAERAALDAKVKTLSYIFSLDYAWQEKENSGNKLKRVQNGGNGINQTVRVFISNMIEGTINTTGITLLLISQGTWISFSLGIFIIVFYILSVILISKAAKQGHIVSKKEEDVEGLAFESINNVRTVKSLDINERIISSIVDAVEKLFIEIKRRIFLFQSRGAILNVFYHAYAIGMIAFLVFSVINGRYDISIIILFVAYIEKVAVAVWELSDIMPDLLMSKIWIQRMKDILDTKPAIDDSKKLLPYPKEWNKISFKNVHFSYGNQANLNNLNFEIERGQKVGIVGISGAGKSTLFKLLLDLYEDYSGAISIDNLSLKDISRSDYIKHVAVVLQDTELFNISLKDNIGIASQERKEVNEQLLKDIINNSNLEDLVSKLPEKENTVIGEKGIKLSGGEKQRLGIARALYRNPDILLLDEATSHLDADSERQIQEALNSFFEKVTAIVIAHRLSTIKKMDKILVLKEGEIVEEGTFEELIKKDGHFAMLWKKQKI